MCSLELLPRHSLSDERTLSEKDGKLYEGDSAVSIIDEELIYPTIRINSATIMKPSLLNERVEDVFIDKPISLWHKIRYKLRHQGFVCVLNELATHSFQDSESRWHRYLTLMITYMAIMTLKVWQMGLTLYSHVYPYAFKSNEELITQFNRSLDWKNGVIRAFSWHPNFYRCALCLINDEIFIYSSTNSSVPLLKHPLQRKVTDLCWRPNMEEMLAVSCESSVLLWTIDPNLKTTRISINCVRIIKNILPSPLTCITFNCSGDYLATCSPQSSKFALIKMSGINKETNVTISCDNVQYIGCYGTGITSLKWSPDKSRLFASTTSFYVRVFENMQWSSKKWSQGFEDICGASCWSQPNGRILLFSPKETTSVFAIAFFDPCQAKEVGGTQTCAQVMDVSEIELDNGIKIGGRVHDMVWDRNGRRLAVSFKDNSQYIILYKTRIIPTLEILPIGIIHGLRNEIPLMMTFHESFKSGSLLTVCYSSGHISHLPLQYQKKFVSVNTTDTPRSLSNYWLSPSPSLSNPYSPSNAHNDSSNWNSISYCQSHFNNSNMPNNSPLKHRITDSAVSPRKPTLFSLRLTNGHNDSMNQL